MLGKLIKYELKATSRWFMPIYVLALLLAPIERLSINYMEKGIPLAPPLDRITNLLFFSITFAFVIALIAIGMASGLLIIYRFYKNLITNEGYLMHTLPVKTSQLIWSKAIAAILWTLVSGVVICLAIFFLVVGTPGWNKFVNVLPEAISSFFWYYGTNISIWKAVLEVFAIAVIGSLANIFMVYASIALGQLITKHKILGAFGAYFLLNMALQFLSTLVVLPAFTKLNEMAFDTADSSLDLILNAIFPGTILFTALITIALYFITSYIFKNRLNLE